MRSVQLTLIGAALAALALCPSITSAQAATPPAAAAPSASAQYGVALGRGMSAMAAGDRAGAASAVREAVQLNPSRADAVCLLAEVQRAGGELPAALEGFTACARVAQASSDARWTARGLHGVASTLELMDGRLEDARTAWQAYVRFADSATSHATPQVGRARIQAIDVVTEQERVYVEVRARIAAREEERRAAAAAAPAPSGRAHR